MRLGRPRRPGRALLALVVVALLSAGGRAVWSNGVFSSAKTGFSGTCKAIANLPGVLDMEAANGMAFLSVGNARGPSAGDGIYAMAPDGSKPVKLAGAPADFHPRGIGLFRTPDGKGLFLFAVNKRSVASAHAGATKNPDRFSIDTFEVTNPAGPTPSLVAQGTIEGGLLVNPQDVAAVSPGSFYVANGTASSFAPMHWLQTWGVLSGGNVLYFNGMMFRQVTDGLYGTRSLVMAGDRLVVGGLLSRSVTSFTREPFSGALTEDKVIVLPTGPEKLSVDGSGQVWAAGHANLFDWKAMTADPHKRASSQIFRVRLDGEDTQQVYGNAGGEIAGASVALPMGQKLLMGSSLDGRLLLCTQ
jgi:hypothetical protein